MDATPQSMGHHNLLSVKRYLMQELIYFSAF